MRGSDGLEARMVEQEVDVGVVEDVEVLLERIARIDRRPDDARRARCRAGRHRPSRGSGCRPRPCRRAPAPPPAGRWRRDGSARARRIGPAARAVMQAVALGIEIGAAVEVVDQAHVSFPRAARGSRAQRALHQHAVEPAAELEADALQRADHLEAAGGMEPIDGVCAESPITATIWRLPSAVHCSISTGSSALPTPWPTASLSM